MEPPWCVCERACACCRRKMQLGPDDVFLQKAPISFDASVQELFHSLACNGKLLLAAPGGEKDTQYLARLCRTKRVTCASFVPSQLDVLLQARAAHHQARAELLVRTPDICQHCITCRACRSMPAQAATPCASRACQRE